MGFRKALPAVFAGLVSSPAFAYYIESVQPFVGVTHFRLVQKYDDFAAPLFDRPVVMDVLKIDTDASGVFFEMQGGNGADPGEITRQTTRSFVDGINAQIGINVGFYDTSTNYGGLYTDLIHIAASKGSVYSKANNKEPMFNIASDNTPRISIAGPAGSSKFNDGSSLYNAAGGNQRILNNGVEISDGSSYTTALNPHTAFGLDQSNRYVFLATVDGRQGSYSSGMRTDEMAVILRDSFGVWNAINLDGGGSTTMVMDDSNDTVQNARVVNSPSDNSTAGHPGTERVVANSLAVFATPKSGYTPLAPAPRPPGTGVRDTYSDPVVLDSFDQGGKGHFTWAPSASGSIYHVATSSTTEIDSTKSAHGGSSLKVQVNNTGGTPTGMQLRLLSGGGSPDNNVSPENLTMGNGGYLGVFLRMDPGSGPLYASVLLDDGSASSTGTELGEFFPIVADGAFHLYQWNLNEDGHWTSFSNGNGTIDGPNLFLDALYFSSAPTTSGGANFTGTIWIDTVAYNPDGPIDLTNLPDPASSAGISVISAIAMARRSRRTRIGP